MMTTGNSSAQIYQSGPSPTYNMTDPDLRSSDEIITFLSIDISLTAVRLIAGIFFIVKTWSHLSITYDKRDKFTAYTFLLFGISVLSLVAYHSAEIAEQMAIWKTYYDERARQRVLKFLAENLTVMRLGQGIVRIGFGFIL